MSFPIYRVKTEEPEEEPVNASAGLPKIVKVVSGAELSNEQPGSTRNPSAGDNVPSANAPTAVKESTVVATYASPAWYFFGVPGGSSNLQREPKVNCMLCQAQVKRGTNPGKLGTTCLFTHLERRHNLTREEVFEAAAAAGYCGPIITRAPATTAAAQTWKCRKSGSGLVLIPIKRTNAEKGEGRRTAKRQATMTPSTSSAIPDLAKCQTTIAHTTSSKPDKTRQPATQASSSRRSGTLDLSKCQALTAPATLSGPSESSDLSSLPSHSGLRHQTGGRSRVLSSAYHQALRDRLLSSVHMYCKVCHVLILSGERSQSARDLTLETHFSSQHPHMFNRLKRGAVRDARLGSLGPSVVPSGSHPGNFSPSSNPR